MDYINKELKKGIKFHFIKNDKFKTNLIAIFLTTPLDRKGVTKNALIPAILRRGSAFLNTQDKISKTLEEMYGAVFDCGIDKKGENQVLKYYIEVVNDEFLPNEAENLYQKSLKMIFDIVFNPLIEDDSFNIEYLEQEKSNLNQVIEAKKDNKARYALERCMEEVNKDMPSGLYKYGYAEDLDGIDSKNLYSHYQELISKCKIDIFVSGKLEENQAEENIENLVKDLKEREPNFIKTEYKEVNDIKEKEIQESLEVTQGKLVLGMKVKNIAEKEQYATMLYNSILGGSANSKLFQNVREKASLAYTASSSYMRLSNEIFINSGIEIENYQKALDIIRKQLEDMKKGDFTDEEIENAKKGIISAIEAIDDEQDSEIMYFFGQEFFENVSSLEEYKENIQKVTREQIIDIANKVCISVIYFLRD